MKILSAESRRESYSLKFSANWNRSINVLLEAALLLEVGDKQHRFVGRPRAELPDDIDQRAFDIPGHPFCIATDIDAGAFGEPGPQFAADLAHTVLHIEFLISVARPRQRHPRQQAGGLHGVELVA